MTFCPLCGLSKGEKPSLPYESKSKQVNFENEIQKSSKNLTNAQKRKLFWEISGIILLSGSIATMIINLVLNKTISWSLYNVVVSLALFANLSCFTFSRKKVFFLVLGNFLSNALLIILLDLISSNTGWGIKLGIPILVSLYALLVIVLWIVKISKHHGFNILSAIFFAIGIFLICTEIFISLYFKNAIQLRWSIIAESCLIPISTLLLFVHYRLKVEIKLRRFFDI
ncbi:DUF6320 domain-containing protein [Marinifilum flexuosum]|uniref:DUF6320 domain-containing protein n=1 Tax=Marinifilum flexuosum TaxID=1117708 RepID=UPI003CD0D8B1